MEMNVDKKLEYLKETKEAMKSALINKGVEVSDNDTFRSYASKIRNVTGSLDVDNISFGDIANDFDGLVILGPEAEVTINTPKYETSPNITFEAKNKSSSTSDIGLYDDRNRVFTFNYGLNPIVLYGSYSQTKYNRNFYNVNMNKYHSTSDFNDMYSTIHGIKYNGDDSYSLVICRYDEGYKYDLVKYNPGTDTMSVIKENLFPDVLGSEIFTNITDDEIILYNCGFDNTTRVYSLDDTTNYTKIFYGMPFDQGNSNLPYKVTINDLGYYQFHKVYREYSDFWIYKIVTEIDFENSSMSDSVYINYPICESGWLYGSYTNLCYNDGVIYIRPNVSGGEDYSFEDFSTRADYLITFNENTNTFSREVLYEGVSVGQNVSYSEDASFYSISHGILVGKEIYILSIARNSPEIICIFEGTEYGIGMSSGIENTEEHYSYFTNFEYHGLETIIKNPEILGKYNLVCGPSKGNMGRDKISMNYGAGLHPIRLFSSADVKLPVYGVLYNGRYVPYLVKDSESGGWMRYE